MPQPGGHCSCSIAPRAHAPARRRRARLRRRRLEDGSFPPPPLNGTGHAWHHPLVALYATIATSQGRMPGHRHRSRRGSCHHRVVQSRWGRDLAAAWALHGPDPAVNVQNMDKASASRRPDVRAHQSGRSRTLSITPVGSMPSCRSVSGTCRCAPAGACRPSAHLDIAADIVAHHERLLR